MPNIRIMNWNIEQLSCNKIQIPGMADAIARTVVSQQIDILVLLEVKSTRVNDIMTLLSVALNNQSGGNNYRGWFLSFKTGGEYYGFVIRDMNIIRPLQFNILHGQSDGTSNHPLSNLKEIRWDIWPNNHWAHAYPIPVNKPRMPLTDLYATEPPRGRKRARFSGQTFGGGGYSLGRGYRLPCLAMFMVHTAANNYLIPIICCHYGAVRSGRNHLAQGQASQLKYLHIAQLFRDSTPGGPFSHYINVNGAPVSIQEILFTGDFNLDFLQNSPGAGASFIAYTNNVAISTLTQTQQHGGSAPPAPPGAQPGAPGPPPVVPFPPPFNPGPITSDITNQDLKAAVTTQGTILHHYDAAVNPANTAALKGAAFDNFIYGGTRLSGATIHFGVGNVDSGNVVDVPANIVQNGGIVNPEHINIQGIASHYYARGTKNANAAPSLRGIHGAAHPLTVNDRLIGARLVSDHLPVVLEFNCP